jgi:hypothetical protein
VLCNVKNNGSSRLANKTLTFKAVIFSLTTLKYGYLNYGGSFKLIGFPSRIHGWPDINYISINMILIVSAKGNDI